MGLWELALTRLSMDSARSRGPLISQTRKSSFGVAMRFPDVTKSLKGAVRHSKRS